MSSTPFLAIRETTDAPDTASDGLMYPVALDTPDTVALEAADGPDPKQLVCIGFSMRPVVNKTAMVRLTDINAALIITRARLVFACSKYEKGGGWFGVGAGALLALPANLGSKALAARRRQGKMLVGHVRYPWINGVYAKNKGGWKPHKAVAVTIKSGGYLWQLDFTLRKEEDAAAVVSALVRRAAAFRLEHEDLDSGENAATKREKLSQLANSPSFGPVKGTELEGLNFPTHWPVGDKSARFGLDASGDAAT